MKPPAPVTTSRSSFFLKSSILLGGIAGMACPFASARAHYNAAGGLLQGYYDEGGPSGDGPPR